MVARFSHWSAADSSSVSIEGLRRFFSLQAQHSPSSRRKPQKSARPGSNIFRCSEDDFQFYTFCHTFGETSIFTTTLPTPAQVLATLVMALAATAKPDKVAATAKPDKVATNKVATGARWSSWAVRFQREFHSQDSL